MRCAASKKEGLKPIVLYVSTAHIIGMIFGLPEVTVFTVGGAVIFLIILLVLWGIFFPKVNE